MNITSGLQRMRWAWVVALALFAAGMLAGCGSDEIASLPEAVASSGTGLQIRPPAQHVFSIPDNSGSTPMSVAWDGTYHYSVSGGTPSGNRFARYLPDGAFDASFAPGLDFRAIFTDDAGNLYAKAYGPTGTVYSFTVAGVGTPLFDLNDPQSQGKVAFNGNDSVLYLRDGDTVRRYDAASGALLGSFILRGLLPEELIYPADMQIATSPDGRLFTYAVGIVSEWNLAGERIAITPIPIATPTNSSTSWSFSLAANGLVYLYNANTAQWDVFYIGIGTLPGQPVLSFTDNSGSTPMSVAWDGTYHYSASGGTTSGNRFARYLPDGAFDASFAPGLDFRAIFTDDAGNLYAKAYGPTGTVYSFTVAGVGTPLIDLNDPQSQGKAAFNGDDSQLYLRDGNTVRRYDAASGALLGSFTLQNLAPEELTAPADVQIATSPDGRLFTYAAGFVSEWSLAGKRLRKIWVPIATPNSSNTSWSFAVAGNGLAYLFDANGGKWVGFYIGVGQRPGRMVQSFTNNSGSTPMAGTWDGTYHYTVSGGTTSGNRFARYLPDGTFNAFFAPGLDFRTIFTDHAGNLFAKEFGATGTVYSFTSAGVGTPLFALNDAQSQGKVAFNGDDSQLYLRDGATVRRYDAASGALLGSFTLQNLAPEELVAPADVQIATSPDGHIFTYAGGFVSQWSLSGKRLRRFWLPIATPTNSSTTWSFSLAGNGLIYLYNANTAGWELYDY